MLQLATPALLGLLITASLLVVVNDWRVLVILLAVQYGCMAILETQIAVWPVVAVKLMNGWLVVAILALTVLSLRPGWRGSFEFATGLPFRVLATLAVIVAAWSTAGRGGYDLPGLPPALNIASFLLVALGLLNLGLTEEPINAGLGLLTVLSGFDVAYTAVEPSLAVVGLLAAVNFGIAMAASYLAVLRYASESERPS